MALAHSTHSATEAAYARGDMLLKRRRLMEDWAQFLTVPEREIEDLIEIQGGSEGVVMSPQEKPLLTMKRTPASSWDLAAVQYIDWLLMASSG